GAIEPRHHVAPRRRDGDAVPRHALLERAEPDGVGAPLAQQRAALAHRLIVSGEARCVLGIEAIDKSVEEAPPRRRALDEEPIHLWRQPYEVDMLGKHRLAARR